MNQDQSTFVSVDEASRRRFESAWKQGRRPAIEDHLPAPDDPRHAATLEELVLIEMELAWKSRSAGAVPPKTEDYLSRFPGLAPAAHRLARHEFAVRLKSGGDPQPAEFAARFPGLEIAPDTNPPNATPTVRGFDNLVPLGKGGMGVVYRARQTALGRTVALKMLRFVGDPQEAARFRVEAEAAARLQHPNIIQVFEVGEAAGGPYLAMEYVPGMSLDLHMGGAPQEPRLSAATVSRLARAMHFAHRSGVVHRDLKPANILLAADSDGSGSRSVGGLPWVPKIADFGLAKRIEEGVGQTQSGTVLGTPGYMAPEQARGRRDVGPAADIYALGAVLYDMLTGRPPFRAATAWETISQVLHDEPPPPSRLRPGLPADLETVCLKCLAKEPQRRYATAEELAEDLDRFLAGEPIRARPVGAVERTFKWVRRRPMAAALAVSTAVAALASVGVAVATHYGSRLADALELADTRRADAESQRADAERNRAEAAAQRVLAERSADEARRQREAAEHNAAEAIAQRAEAQSQRAEAERQKVRAERFRYTSDMSVAQRAWEQGDLPRTLEVLDHHNPKRDEPDLRGFEWHFLRRLTRNLHTLHRHTHDVNGVSFSGDGTQFATVGFDGRLYAWNTRAGAAYGRVVLPHRRAYSVAISPDGRRVAASFDNLVAVYGDNREQFRLQGHTKWIQFVIYSRDGKRIATCGGDGTARLWNAADGKHLFTLTGEPDEVIRRVAFSPDGSRLLWATRIVDARQKSVAGRVKVWDLVARTETFSRKWDGHGCSDAAFHPDGKRVAATSLDGSLRIWDTASGEEQLNLSAHPGGATSVAFSPEGDRILTAGYDLVVRVWDLAGKEQLALHGHIWRGASVKALGMAGISQAVFSPDGKRAVSVGDDRTVRIWDVTPDTPATKPLPPANGAIADDGSWVAVVKGTSVVVAAPDGRVLRTFTAGNEPIRYLLPTRSNRHVTVGSGATGRDTVRVWDITSDKVPPAIRVDPDDRLVTSPDGRKLAAYAAHRVRIFDAGDGRETTEPAGHEATIRRAVFSWDGSRLATAGEDAMVRVWDTTTGASVAAMRGHYWTVRDLDWSRDGTRIASASQDGLIGVWDPSADKLVRFLTGHKGSVLTVAFHPDGQRIASGSSDQTARIWDVATGQEVLTLKSLKGSVRDVAFSGDGRRLETTTYDDEPNRNRFITIWNAQPREP